MKYINRLGIILLNFAMGFISFWWFILSYACAINIGHAEDEDFLRPFGLFALIILPIILIGINWYIYKHENKSLIRQVFLQIAPLILGLAVSVFLSTLW